VKNLSLTINRSAMHRCKGFFEIIAMHSFSYSFTLTKGPLIPAQKAFLHLVRFDKSLYATQVL